MERAKRSKNVCSSSPDVQDVGDPRGHVVLWDPGYPGTEKSQQPFLREFRDISQFTCAIFIPGVLIQSTVLEYGVRTGEEIG